MRKTQTLQLGKRGVLTLPKTLREDYSMDPGDLLTLLDIGGVFVLSPGKLDIDDLSAKVTKELIEEGEDLESMLKVLRERRERYGDEDPNLP